MFYVKKNFEILGRYFLLCTSLTLRAGLQQSGGIFSHCFPALAHRLARLASGPCRAIFSRPAAAGLYWQELSSSTA
jgi:hypothetical protein